MKRKGPTLQEQQVRQAEGWHRDMAAAFVAKALGMVQQKRGPLVADARYDELEASALVSVYMVLLHLMGATDDTERQLRIMERARAMAREKIGEVQMQVLDDAGHIDSAKWK